MIDLEITITVPRLRFIEKGILLWNRSIFWKRIYMNLKMAIYYGLADQMHLMPMN
jgi:hypothetical protein